MNLTKSLLFLLLSGFLAGCSFLQPQPEIVTKTEIITKDIPLIPRPDGLQLKPVTWKVLTEDNADEVLQTGQVYVIMTIEDYQILSVNMADLKEYLHQQKKIIIYYEESITE
jgi:hypothetical protein